MTLEEAIKHCEGKAGGCSKCADEHSQLAEWLRELKDRREKDKTMDIKERIDALSEAEAKAALENIVSTISVLQPCKAGANRYCPHWSNCKIVHGELCDNVWLDYALKEANRVAGY